MKILVVGGNKFLGRVFIMQAYSNNEIYTINRGSHHEIEKFGVIDPIISMIHQEYIMDRHDITKLSNINIDFDAVVDFCGYNQNDIKLLTDYLHGKTGKYILISTVDVYQKIGSDHDFKKEDFPFEQDTSVFPLDYQEYINGKIILEQELAEECHKKNIPYCSIRPSIIYGPYNYAPREKIYIEYLIKTGQIVFPEDASGKFQFVYVKDVANAILKLCEKEKIANSYNLCSNDILDYNKFSRLLLECVDVPYQDWYLPYQTIIENQLPLPFPYLKQDTELCDGSKITEDIDFSYTPHQEGMQKTYKAFKNVYSK